MIKLLRVDNRLLHGQVAVSWVNAVGTNCVGVAGDHISDIVITAMKLCKPAGVKLVIKTVDNMIADIKAGRTEKYNLFLLVGNIKDAYRIAKEVPEITEINIGRTDKNKNYEYLNNETCISEEQKVQMRELIDRGVIINLQMIPTTKATPLKNLI